MTGLFLLGVLGVWLAIVVWIAWKLTRGIKRNGLRQAVFGIAIVGLFPLIVIDEMITAPQFEKLCEEGTKLKFDPEKIRGRTIYLASNPQPDISIGLMNGYYIPSRYMDATTKEELISYNSYHLKGGVFISALGISEKNAPLTMRSYCSPAERPWQKTFLNRYDIKYIEQKNIK